MSEEAVFLYTFNLVTILLVLIVWLVSMMMLSNSKQIEQLMNSYEKELLKSQLEMQAQTLSDIYREIHDNIGSSISIARAYLDSDTPTIEKIKNASALLKKARNDLRDLSKGLSLDSIKEEGLSKAIEDMVDQLKKIARYEIAFKVTGNYNLMDEQVEIIAFRILQEAIDNIIRHSEATCILIAMTCKDDSLCLEIQDDGRGFDVSGPDNKPGGLSNMRIRAALIDATLKIVTSVGGGTRISLCIPPNTKLKK